MEIRFAVPKNAATVTPELGAGALPPTQKGVAAAVAAAAAGQAQSQMVEYVQKDREVVWKIKRFQGQSEHTLRTRITLGTPSTSNIRKEVGPISMSFEIPMYNTSNLNVKYLRIAEQVRTVVVLSAHQLHCYSIPQHPPNIVLASICLVSLLCSPQSKGYQPHRWVRYVSQSSSYVCRL